MSSSSTPSISDPEPGAPALSARRWSPGLLWAAAAISIGVIVVFFLQVFWVRRLVVPWYLPIGGTLAAAAALYSIGATRHWWRVTVAIAIVAVACLEWYFILAMTVLPRYTGPIVEGATLPAFGATLADGTEFNRSHFEQSPMTAIVFFQGRWCPFCMTQLRELEANHAVLDRVGAKVVVVSIEDLSAAAQTQRDFPHLTVVSDERREMANAIDLINKNFAPDGGDAAAPTILLVDRDSTVKWLFRPTRFIARPSSAELAAAVEARQDR